MSIKEDKAVLVNSNYIEKKILNIRGLRVMVDRDIALLYGVRTIALRQQVKRNMDRFPGDFMFQINEEEIEFLVSHNVIPSKGSLGGFLPFVFTEQGVAMLSSVLTTKQAVMVNIEIMRTFSKLREAMGTHKELRVKIEEMEKKYDNQFKAVFEAIKRLVTYPDDAYKKTKIGFKVDK